MMVQYDPAVISVEEVQHGAFLSGGNQDIAIVQRVDAEHGQAIISATRQPNTPGVSGSGTLLGLVVKAKAPGNAKLSIVQVNAIGLAAQGDSLVTGEATVQVQRSPNEESPARLEHGNTEQNPVRTQERTRDDAHRTGDACGILVILAGAALPIARRSIKYQREAELRRDLQYMRDCIDRYKDAAEQESDSHGSRQRELSAGFGDAGQRRKRTGQEGTLHERNSRGPDDEAERLGIPVRFGRSGFAQLVREECVRRVFQFARYGYRRAAILRVVRQHEH